MTAAWELLAWMRSCRPNPSSNLIGCDTVRTGIIHTAGNQRFGTRMKWIQAHWVWGRSPRSHGPQGRVARQCGSSTAVHRSRARGRRLHTRPADGCHRTPCSHPASPSITRCFTGHMLSHRSPAVGTPPQPKKQPSNQEPCCEQNNRSAQAEITRPF